MVVEKGNKIFIPADQLTAVEVKVEWSKSLTNYSEQYYTVPFFNKDQSNEESVIFIQKSYLEALKSKRAPGDDLTIIVDDSFQYGQNKEKTKRWLAFHNKKNEAYQWRFVEGLKSKLGQAALKFANGFFPSIDLGMLKLLFGDYLHNF
ncbi:hypothetical protein SNK03_010668 [Fusarium graminearum]|uniref:Chromosome 3, complete genome n=3 Tax=Fusarium sambucinum species complex TaxID=569360 RepID=I1RLJ2_GIBZE|nr:hypothetical protein FGSG_04795 [Fusarium graminearum PH-1]EYB27080.1 hypothetical protein FG05_04795 [Fusarium graminearum]KAF5227181.1 hypothetical protein FAUST_11941 [Fusarium austroamericanum]ESU10665.1 hypothetical protein FGSG_04795 [Fusarium graminearum PH-1]KAI6758083.1 hypothetical protein HG531_003908 [Fusarium graminearum]PCD34040.1 hypothetical protein FGRA07_09195 [Fusarium graminearum]|eukprot:XP_011323241.1 hypothetical protein FGSG_04795 [Fusarium graminearum PH-1]